VLAQSRRRHMFSKEEEGWSNPKVLAILAVVFLCGAAFGAAAVRQYLHNRMPVQGGREFVYQGKRLGLEQLKTELQLRPEQALRVELMLDDFAKYYQNIEDQRSAVAVMGKEKILDVLDADQKQRFEQMLHGPGH
jgi:hypothetical protein